MEYLVLIILSAGGGIAFHEYWLSHQPWYQNIKAALKKKTS